MTENLYILLVSSEQGEHYRVWSFTQQGNITGFRNVNCW